MTGFKGGSGAAEDPFGDDSSETAGQSQQFADEPESSPEEPTDTDNSGSDSGRSGLPWIYKRDSISDGRSTVQLHLQQSTLESERQRKLDVEDHLGESVAKADLREAAILVGMAHTDEIADVLREWGYDFE